MTNDEKTMVEKYDQEAIATGWLGPEVAFGLSYKYVKPGQTVLDIGIGTGLGAILFHKAGLNVFGMDVSDEMLAACRSNHVSSQCRADQHVAGGQCLAANSESRIYCLYGS